MIIRKTANFVPKILDSIGICKTPTVTHEIKKALITTNEIPVFINSPAIM